MPLPPGHYAETRQPRKLGARERSLLAVGAVLVAAIVAVTTFSLTSSRTDSGHGCLSFTYAMVMGGEEFQACGQKAVETCATPPKLGGLANGFLDRLRDACERADLPYKTSS